ncbi:heat domain-containing protein [Rivularia sp. IAM M-261]|nr:heat domain-containing protein [Calothrix sp. PCC 7716]GJD17858.1 heat domain-containing protein [Rivularia sp. IAM M-261]
MNSVQQLISAVEEADSSAKLVEAVQNLASSGSEDAVPTLIAALGYNNPGAAVAAVDGLIEIGEKSVKPLLQLLDNYNYGARAWAVRALAGIGDPRGFNTLLDAAKNDFALSVRRAAARGLGTIHWQQMPSEQRSTSQQQALETLIQVCRDPEWVVRYAAVTGLEALANAASETQPDKLPQITAPLLEMANNDEEVAIRARAWMAIHQHHSQIEMPNMKKLAESDDEKEVPSRGSGRRS